MRPGLLRALALVALTAALTPALSAAGAHAHAHVADTPVNATPVNDTQANDAHANDAHAKRVAAWDARRLWLNAGFYSAHFDAHAGLRDANPGLGAQYQLGPDWAVTAGRFLNSDSAHSLYVGAYYQPWRAGHWKLGAVGGAFNGYPKAFGGGWFPAVLPVATYTSGHWGLNVALVPPLRDRLYGAITFQLMFRLQDDR